MPARLPYTRESVEHALRLHAGRGAIRGWQPLGGGRYRLELVDGPDLQTRSLRETYVFVNGLASAHHAPPRAAAPPPDRQADAGGQGEAGVSRR